MRESVRTALAALAAAFGLAMTASPALAQAEADLAQAGLAAARLTDWVVASGDNDGLPFVIVDKAAAVVFVYHPDGRLAGAGPALLGLARGDESVPGIGDRELSDIRPEERTTPAGRFVGGFGPALGQGKALWVDFATAISLHPVVTTNRKEQRVKRLRSPSPEDNRITYGCINVSAELYREVIEALFKDSKGVFYVLPDTRPLEEVFPRLPLQMHASGPAEPAVDAGFAAEDAADAIR